MPITILGGGADGYGGGMPVSLSVPSGADFFMLVALDTPTPALTGTLGGQTLSIGPAGSTWFYNQVSNRILYKTAPVTGGSVSLNLNSDATTLAWVAASGVDQTTPYNPTTEFAFLDESTTFDSQDTIASAIGEYVLHLFTAIGFDGTLTGFDATQGGTEIISLFDSFGAGIIGEAGAASVTLGAQPVGTGFTRWSVGANTIRLNAAAVAPGYDPVLHRPRRSRLIGL